MIFVTVGTHEQPFNRLIQKVDELKRDGVIKDDVIIQTGFSTYKPKYCQWSKLISYQQMVKNVADARIVITHGGLAAVSSSFFAALCSAFGRYDVVHIHAEGPAFFCWIPKLFGKRVISTRMCRSKDLYSLSVNRQKSKNRTLFSTTAEFWWRRRFTDLTVRL